MLTVQYLARDKGGRGQRERETETHSERERERSNAVFGDRKG